MCFFKQSDDVRLKGAAIYGLVINIDAVRITVITRCLLEFGVHSRIIETKLKKIVWYSIEYGVACLNQVYDINIFVFIRGCFVY